MEIATEDKPFTNRNQTGWILRRLRFRKADTTKARGWTMSVGELSALARSYGMAADEIAVMEKA